MTFSQVGPDVVATGTGSINLSDLTFVSSGGTEANVIPSMAREFTGPTSSTVAAAYGNASGPTSFGPGTTLILANSGSGDLVGLSRPLIWVPDGYVSGAPLTDTATYTGQSFASLGLTPGTYLYTWGSGPNADTFTVQIGGSAAVPEPASLMLLGAGLLGLGLARRKPM